MPRRVRLTWAWTFRLAISWLWPCTILRTLGLAAPKLVALGKVKWGLENTSSTVWHR